MRTTLLNPTVWLLAATFVAAVAGAFRRRHPQESIAQVLRYATPWPVLMVLGLLAAGGIGTRAVLGFMSPGAYAEEVVAARAFLEDRQLYGASSDAGVAEALTGTEAPLAAWARLPGITPCQTNAMANRARFYTDHAHPPMLLLAGVPIVHLGGGRALYAVLAMLSAAAVLVMAAVLANRWGIAWTSRNGLLLLVAIAAWQPVLAGIRQGDAVLLSAGLVALAWYSTSSSPTRRAGLAGGLASCLTVPGIGVLPALLRSAPPAGLLAIGILLAAAGGTIALAGVTVVSDFVQTIAETARTYAAAPSNYGVAGRFLAAGFGGLALAAAFAAVAVCSWWRARTPDLAFALFLTAGLLIAPVVWSQHLSLLLVPAAILLARIATHGSSLALAVWSLLMLCFSLPDTTTARLCGIISTGVQPIPVVPIAMLALWGWTAFGSHFRRP
jgi:hypothetical protein